jgi:UDP-N-acetylmuramyl pentapeptide phosphotransferase/UDP-N-acetylglucosamine-1-phosphate transferase
MVLSTLLLSILATVLSFIIVLLAVPPILKVARKKLLFDQPDDRKIHQNETPSFGGLAIFLGFIVSITFLIDDISFARLKYILLGTILMLIIGLKDDLIGISPFKKFAIQLITAFIIIFFGKIQITSFHGVFGIYELNTFWGALISFIAILTIINAFNLIDGIDGLAAGLGMLASLAFGIWFFFSGFTTYVIISFALFGSLGGFFLYNVFGKSNKIFMGDTGSLFLGLIIAILTVKFNELNVNSYVAWSLNTAPVISFAILMVPLIDLLRVMSIRISNRKSPFYPDKNHIHHKMLQLIPCHKTVTFIIVTANVFLIALALLLNYLSFNITIQLLTIIFSGVTLSFIPSLLHRIIIKKSEKQIYFSKLITWPD